MPLLATAPGPSFKTSRLNWTTFMSGAPGGPKPTDPNDKKNLGIKVLEVLCQRFNLWAQDIDRRTDDILDKDISTLSDAELEIFYNLNDLHLDLQRNLISLTYARNISVTTSDTGGTA